MEQGCASLQETEKADEDAVIYFGYDASGKLSGIAIPGAEPGYQDLIYGIYGYRPDQQTIIGFKVLESKETPGLGDKILSDPDFAANFTRLLVEPQIEVVKKGEKKSENQVEAITGATISSNAVGACCRNLWKSGSSPWQITCGKTKLN